MNQPNAAIATVATVQLYSATITKVWSSINLYNLCPKLQIDLSSIGRPPKLQVFQVCHIWGTSIDAVLSCHEKVKCRKIHDPEMLFFLFWEHLQEMVSVDFPINQLCEWTEDSQQYMAYWVQHQLFQDVEIAGGIIIVRSAMVYPPTIGIREHGKLAVLEILRS